EGFANALIGLWAFAMGVQSAAVLSLGAQGVITTAATLTVIVLMSHVAARRRSSPETRRLFCVLIALSVGAAAGGALLAYARAFAPVLPFAVTALVFAVAARTQRRDSPQD